METVVQHSSELCIPKHLSCHNDLAPFSDLMKWLKEVDQTVFLELCQVLVQCHLPSDLVCVAGQISIVTSNEATTNRSVHALKYAARTGVLRSSISSEWKDLRFLTDNVVLEDLNSM